MTLPYMHELGWNYILGSPIPRFGSHRKKDKKVQSLPSTYRTTNWNLSVRPYSTLSLSQIKFREASGRPNPLRLVESSQLIACRMICHLPSAKQSQNMGRRGHPSFHGLLQLFQKTLFEEALCFVDNLHGKRSSHHQHDAMRQRWILYFSHGKNRGVANSAINVGSLVSIIQKVYRVYSTPGFQAVS